MRTAHAGQQLHSLPTAHSPALSSHSISARCIASQHIQQTTSARLSHTSCPRPTPAPLSHRDSTSHYTSAAASRIASVRRRHCVLAPSLKRQAAASVSQMTESAVQGSTMNIVLGANWHWPPHPPLRGIEAGSFAEGTILKRLPAILTGMLVDVRKQQAHFATIGDAEAASQVAVAVEAVEAMISDMVANALVPKLTCSTSAAAPLKAIVEQTNACLGVWFTVPCVTDTTTSGTSAEHNNTTGDHAAATPTAAAATASSPPQHPSQHLQSGSTWLTLPWLLVECYMYVRLSVIISDCPPLAAAHYDPFAAQKRDAWVKSHVSVASIAVAVLPLLQKQEAAKGQDASIAVPESGNKEEEELRAALYEVMQYALWGNKTDLSLLGDVSKMDAPQLAEVTIGSGGGAGSGKGKDSGAPHPLLVADHFADLWQHVQHLLASSSAAEHGAGNINGEGSVSSTDRKSSKNGRTVHLVLDNAAIELFADLCLADFLVTSGIAQHVYFHGKALPWFVSDVMEHDFQETLDACTKPATGVDGDAWAPVQQLGGRWHKYISHGVWSFSSDPFWTTPLPFCLMPAAAPELYSQLQSEDVALTILKGDLNYRKLTYDCRWPWTTPFTDALMGFAPVGLLSLRTLKADVVVGLAEGEGERLQEMDPDWQVTGKFGLVQVAL